MKVTRIYTDEHGETHFADDIVALQEAGPIGRLSERVPVRAVIFRTNAPHYNYDWHNAPARQYVVLLDGAIELEVSNGERRILRGGDLLLLEDVTGKGHRTRHLEPHERRSLFIELE